MTGANVTTRARLTCPQCGHLQETEMPTDACQFFFECAHCKTLSKPQEGDCCVFCSYADVRCPPEQLKAAGQEP